MVSSTGRPASPSDGQPVQVTAARRAGKRGATSPVASTAANRAPTAWTHPDPLEWATPAQASTATTLPTTGANQATGCSRDRTTYRSGNEERWRRADRRVNTPQETITPASMARSPTTAPATTTAGPKTVRTAITATRPASRPVVVALTVRHPVCGGRCAAGSRRGDGRLGDDPGDQGRAVAAAPLGDEPVGQAGHGHGLDVLGRDVGAPDSTA